MKLRDDFTFQLNSQKLSDWLVSALLHTTLEALEAGGQPGYGESIGTVEGPNYEDPQSVLAFRVGFMLTGERKLAFLEAEWGTDTRVDTYLVVDFDVRDRPEVLAVYEKDDVDENELHVDFDKEAFSFKFTIWP